MMHGHEGEGVEKLKINLQLHETVNNKTTQIIA